MAEVIDLEELRRISVTLRRMQADQDTTLSRIDGVERRLAIIEERQAEVEVAVRSVGRELEQLDRKLDTVTALVREDVAALDRRIGARLDGMEQRLGGVEHRLDGMDQRLGGVEHRLDGMHQRLGEMDRRFDTIDRRFDEVLAAIAALGRPGAG